MPVKSPFFLLGKIDSREWRNIQLSSYFNLAIFNVAIV
uniref:Uncharacterized protein n=1 Tax=Siphoviridae sp. ctHzJ4 TaxID=2825426 RepID=A0A8S5U0S4_9CAUD|nr:MAG TPA: hypothetical protein [Siphoviridae sp. ctHzJ4]